MAHVAQTALNGRRGNSRTTFANWRKRESRPLLPLFFFVPHPSSLSLFSQLQTSVGFSLPHQQVPKRPIILLLVFVGRFIVLYRRILERKTGWIVAQPANALHAWLHTALLSKRSDVAIQRDSISYSLFLFNFLTKCQTDFFIASINTWMKRLREWDSRWRQRDMIRDRLFFYFHLCV